MNCGNLYTQVCVFVNHIQLNEFCRGVSCQVLVNLNDNQSNRMRLNWVKKKNRANNLDTQMRLTYQQYLFSIKVTTVIHHAKMWTMWLTYHLKYRISSTLLGTLFEANLLFLKIFEIQSCDPLIDCLCYDLCLTLWHTSHSLVLYTHTPLMTSSCFTSKNITTPLLPVNSISSVTGMQQRLYSINKNTRCVVLHTVLWALEHRSVHVMFAHKAMQHWRAHIPSVATCRKCCSAIARTDDFLCKCTQSLFHLLVTVRNCQALIHRLNLNSLCCPAFSLPTMCSDPSHFWISNPFVQSLSLWTLLISVTKSLLDKG